MDRSRVGVRAPRDEWIAKVLQDLGRGFVVDVFSTAEPEAGMFTKDPASRSDTRPGKSRVGVVTRTVSRLSPP